MSRLIVQDLHFARGGRPILRGIHFDHDPGSVLTLLGPSGSGKTTLLWLLSGLLAPDRGQVRLGDARGKQNVGFVFQDGGLWEHLTARAHLDIVLRGCRVPRRERAQRVERVLSETGLAHLAQRRPGELSGGERQRLALARALVIEPQWLFLDEPTSQLDGPSRTELVDLLDRRLRANSAGVVLATHQVDLALRLSDRLAVLEDGHIAQVGLPADVYARPLTLGVAKLLGPAFEMHVNGVTRILRPQEVRFTSDPAGPLTVRACHFAADHWRLEVGDDDTVALAASRSPVTIGTRGHVEPVSP